MPQLQEQITTLQNQLHATLLRRLDLRLGAFGQGDYSPERTEKLNRVLDDLLLGEYQAQIYESELTPLILASRLAHPAQ